MDWGKYKQAYTLKAESNDIPLKDINENLEYAKNLYDQSLPIIYDEIHLGQLIGISYEYLFKVVNDTSMFYRIFRIQKKNGGTRKISEPLPNLKIVQKWILDEILYKIKVHPSAKAYINNSSLKDNVKFHRNQEVVVKLDIVKFFNNIDFEKVYKVFMPLGYTKEICWLLTKLCTLNGVLPQGAATSPYLSNLIMRRFDRKIYTHCKRKKIRYTRYADDLTFSGSVNKYHIISRVENELKKIDLRLNKNKIRVLARHQRQIVTGIVVNEKIQVAKLYRKEIRKNVYYLKKYGVTEHLKYNNAEISIDDAFILSYLKSLIGKIEFVLFINKHDEEMQRYNNEVREIYYSIQT